MKEGEITVKGIILAVYPQGEYGKRISLLCDRYGKITVFAQGAAKQTSKIIGACRPFVCGEFTLAKGKTAWNVHGISVLEAFEEIPFSPETVFTGMYFLELTEYFSQEGMPEAEAKAKLNLLYVGLKALQKHAERTAGQGKEAEKAGKAEKIKISELLIRRVFELKTLMQEGIYTEMPPEGMEAADSLWNQVLTSSLSALYSRAVWNSTEEETESFCEAVRILKNRQMEHRFRSEQYL